MAPAIETYKQKLTQVGMWQMEEPRIKKKFKGRFIDYQDRRLTEVLKGYIAQALFFYITGEPFCEKNPAVSIMPTGRRI